MRGIKDAKISCGMLSTINAQPTLYWSKKFGNDDATAIKTMRKGNIDNRIKNDKYPACSTPSL
jgi:hypothetical protein